MMEQRAGLAAPKIVSLEFTPLQYVLPPEQAYGMARGLNFRRTVALVTVTADDGSTGYGEALGPLAPIREYLLLLRPFFLGRSIFDFELVAAGIYNRLYHFGVQGHHTACLSAINVALHDAIGKSLGVPVHDLIGGKSADRIPCYATTGYLTNDPNNDFEAQLEQIDKTRFAGVKIKIGVSPRSDLERVRVARRILGDDILLMVDINGNYTPDIALESLRAIAPFGIHFRWDQSAIEARSFSARAMLSSFVPDDSCYGRLTNTHAGNSPLAWIRTSITAGFEHWRSGIPKVPIGKRSIRRARRNSILC
jgi:D-galactarolactone cycloisomerase